MLTLNNHDVMTFDINIEKEREEAAFRSVSRRLEESESESRDDFITRSL